MHTSRRLSACLSYVKPYLLCTILLSSLVLVPSPIAGCHLNSDDSPLLLAEVFSFGTVVFSYSPTISLEVSRKSHIDLKFSANFESKGSTDVVFFNVFTNSLEKCGSDSLAESIITLKGFVSDSTYIYTNPYLYEKLTPTVYQFNSHTDSYCTTYNYDIDISNRLRKAKKILLARHESVLNHNDLDKTHVFGSILAKIRIAGCVYRCGDVGSLRVILRINSSLTGLEFSLNLCGDQVFQLIETNSAEVLRSPNYVKCQITAVPHVFCSEVLYFQWQINLPKTWWPPEPPVDWILSALIAIVITVVLQGIYKKLEKWRSANPHYVF